MAGSDLPVRPDASTRSEGAVGVAVIDAVPLFAAGVAASVAAVADLSFTGAARTRAEGVALIDPAVGSVCLWDASLDDPAFGDLALLCAARPRARVIVVAAAHRPIDVAAALRAGACGVLARRAEPGDLVAALRTAAAGRTVLGADDSGDLLESIAHSVRAGPATLTRRERQVLELMGRGLPNRAIADELFISENTVKNHVRRIHEKLQVRSRTEAVIRAAREGIVDIA